MRSGHVIDLEVAATGAERQDVLPDVDRFKGQIAAKSFDCYRQDEAWQALKHSKRWTVRGGELGAP